MNPYEIPDKVTQMMLDVISVRYAEEPEKALAVEKAMGAILGFVEKELKDSMEAIEALEIIGEIIIEMKRRVREKYGNTKG